MSIVIEQLGPDETSLVAGRIAEAFTVLEVTRWLVPDPSKREAVLAGDFEILVGHAMRHGFVHATEDRAAVAVWFPSRSASRLRRRWTTTPGSLPPAASGPTGSSISTSCSPRTTRIRSTTTWPSWRPSRAGRVRGWAPR